MCQRAPSSVLVLQQRQQPLYVLVLLLFLFLLACPPFPRGSPRSAAAAAAAEEVFGARAVVHLEADEGEPEELFADELEEAPLPDASSSADEAEAPEDLAETEALRQGGAGATLGSLGWLDEIEEALASGSTHRLYQGPDGDTLFQLASGSEEVALLLQQLKPLLRKRWREHREQLQPPQLLPDWSEALWERIERGVLLRAALYNRDNYPQSWFVARSAQEGPTTTGALLTPLQDHELEEAEATAQERQM
ncbi:hypothetical protein cyc_07914 [Cyclospora cayetanensis]|uniref:Uncharacterized protein n=1 Tax=Cyclospora cayetanensis TaxID=88456 RepID=A0A1D3CU46_9EIME|nr:hypothetical protein cyc_07914 [Cyclospora cayetanensis]